jgi:hypothetical protein
LSIRRRQVLMNTCIFLVVSFVVFHVSEPYIRTLLTLLLIKDFRPQDLD